jgi:hypothetical protein
LLFPRPATQADFSLASVAECNVTDMAKDLGIAGWTLEGLCHSLVVDSTAWAVAIAVKHRHC